MAEDILSKICVKCGATKEISLFRKQKNRDYSRNDCIDCERVRCREYAKKNKESLKIYAKKRQELGITQSLANKRYHSEERKAARDEKKKDPKYVERVKQIKKKNRDKNKDKYSEYQKKRYLENKEHAIAIKRRWAANNKDYLRYKCFIRRGIKKQASAKKPNEFDTFVMQEASDLALLRKRLTNMNWHIDHIEPLVANNVCGLHNAFNIAVVPEVYNRTKSNKRQLVTHWVQAIDIFRENPNQAFQQ